MNTQRLVVLGLALVAAAGAALMVRSMIGGGTPDVDAKPAPAPIAMSEVLVASANLTPGQKLVVEQVRFEKWPSSAVDASFITREAGSEADAVKGVVVRSSILANQPITKNAIVHADAAGFMAAMLTPGMRAVSINVSAESGAGGFVLPNDRIDVIQTRKVREAAISRTVLSNVRVLAVDQISTQEKDAKTVIAKTATLEVTPEQAELLSTAQSAGQLSLALRPLGDNDEVAVGKPMAGLRRNRSRGAEGPVTIIRYGMVVPSSSQEEPPQ
jgi:pilus assembly protein CpaB